MADMQAKCLTQLPDRVSYLASVLGTGLLCVAVLEGGTCGEVGEQAQLAVCSLDEAGQAALRRAQRLQVLLRLRRVQLPQLRLHLRINPQAQPLRILS